MAYYSYDDIQLLQPGVPAQIRILTLEASAKESDDIVCELHHFDLPLSIPGQGRHTGPSSLFENSVPPSRTDNPSTYSKRRADEASLDEDHRPSKRPAADPPSVADSDEIDHSAGDYEALSWTWGSGEEDEVPIYIRKGNEKLRFDVRKNLFAALKALRKDTRARRIWVDFVCINQKNSNEKDLQVKMMFTIYSNATNVCVWLGEVRDDSDKAMNFMRLVNDFDNWEMITEKPEYKNQWKALAALMDRGWFRRRWIVQELALARNATVHCGKDSILWSEFETAVALFDHAAADLSKFFKGSKDSGYEAQYFQHVAHMGATRLVQLRADLFRFDEDGRISDYRYNLTDLVSNLWFFEAREPHDAIYSVLALASDVRIFIGVVTDATSEQARTPREEKAHPYDDQVTTTAAASETPPTQSQQPISVTQDKNARNGLGEIKNMADTVAHLLKRKRLVNVTNKLLHKIKPANAKAFSISYSKPFFEVCKQFLRHTIPKSSVHNMDILLRPWAPEPKEGQLPSWICMVSKAAFMRIPDAQAAGGCRIDRVNADPLVGQTTQSSRDLLYTACKDLKGDYRFFDGMDDRLQVKGFVLDYVDDCKDAATHAAIKRSWLKLGGMLDSRNRKLPDDQIPQAQLDQFWRTLVADRGVDGSNTKNFYRRAFQHAVHPGGNGIHTARLAQRGHPIMSQFIDRLAAVVTNRRLFKSKNRRNLGLAPHDAENGDYICIIGGISVPVILRPSWSHGDTKPEDGFFTIVGDCYLHTMMDGRAVDLQIETLAELKRDKSRNVGEISRWELQDMILR